MSTNANRNAASYLLGNKGGEPFGGSGAETERTAESQTAYQAAPQAASAPSAESAAEALTASLKPVRLTVYLSPENAEYVEAMSRVRDMSKNAFVNDAIDQIRAKDKDFFAVRQAYSVFKALGKK